MKIYQMPVTWIKWGLMCVLGIWGAGAGTWSYAQEEIETAEGRAAQRARLAQERRVLNQQFDAQDVACQQQFVVTSCREAVKVQRTRALDAIGHQEDVLNALERRLRASEQQRKLDDKLSQQTLLEKEAKERAAKDAYIERMAALENKAQERQTHEMAQQLAASTRTKNSQKPTQSASHLLSEQEKQAKRQVYEEKQKQHIQRLQRREEGLRQLARKQQERDQQSAAKASQQQAAQAAQAQER